MHASRATWTACVLSDMEALNTGGVVALEREANHSESFLRKLTYRRVYSDMM